MPQQIGKACGEPILVLDGVRENPSLQDLSLLEGKLAPYRGKELAVVALGGGSVMDSAKTIAAALAEGADMKRVETHARSDSPLPSAWKIPSLYCIPTTAGTGSEVTRTATLWDSDTGAKFSLSDERLFPKAAILVPSLLTTASRELTLSAGLDALSHAMESVWNIHHNPVSDSLAADAISRIHRHLPLALESSDPQNFHELQTAALLAGLAISGTRTALAHSISYPLTGRFGLRHGLACSFTLPEIAAFTLPSNATRGRILANAFAASSLELFPEELRRWMENLGAYEAVTRVLKDHPLDSLKESLLAPGRAENHLRLATPSDALAILKASLKPSPATSDKTSPRPGCVLWISGLSGAGKSTLSRDVFATLRSRGERVILLDGDEMRAIFGGRLGHGDAERRELAGRYSALCRMISGQGIHVVIATMSLFHSVQKWNRDNIPGYLEIYLKADISTLQARDTKGLYALASKNEISNVVGVQISFEAPLSPDLLIDANVRRTDMTPLVNQILALFESRRNMAHESKG